MNLRFTLGIIVVASLPIAAAPMQELTLGQFLQNNEEALGGSAAIRRVQTIRMSARMVGPGGQEAPLTTWTKRPNLVRSESGIPGKRIIAGYDGTAAWEINPFSGSSTPRKVDLDTTASLSDAGIETTIGSFAGFQAAGHTIALLGKEDFGGTPVYRIQVTRKNGMVASYFVDAATFLPLKTVTEVAAPGQRIEIEAFLSNYRIVEGIVFAHRIEQRVGGDPRGYIIYDKIEINLPMEGSLFAMPGAAPGKLP
jgi:outer membrane lipoprotein-sorting protein